MLSSFGPEDHVINNLVKVLFSNDWHIEVVLSKDSYVCSVVNIFDSRFYLYAYLSKI